MSDDVKKPASFTIRKVGSTQTVSTELLTQSVDIFGALQREQLRRAAMQPWERQAEDERRLAARETVRREAKAAVAAIHDRALAAADSPALVAVLNLHAPVVSAWGEARCEGCDAEGYESEWPAWPCRTYELITGVQPSP